MMSKQKILTAAGILSSFAIAVCGWVLTSKLIDIKSDALLSVTGITQIDTPPPLVNADRGANNGADSDAHNGANSGADSDARIGANSGANNGVNNGAYSGANNGEDSDANSDADSGANEEKQHTMTVQDIYQVLLNWEAAGNERAHEPSKAQLTMEQAINAAKSGLIYFKEQGVIPGEILELDFEKTNAYLCQNQTLEQMSQFLDPVYSYWTVTFAGERMNAALTVNAVTGQIWKANITIPDSAAYFENQYAKQTLNSFISYLKMNSDDKLSIGISKYETVGYNYIADSMIQVVVTIRHAYGNTGIASNPTNLTNIEIYLATQPSEWLIKVSD
ncbi:MAG: hypothetical protein FWH52_01565 [Synergistaceae bacterium]|nr:hypothetical protein [Synergistaceae bacterium]